MSDENSLTMFQGVSAFSPIRTVCTTQVHCLRNGYLYSDTQTTANYENGDLRRGQCLPTLRAWIDLQWIGRWGTGSDLQMVGFRVG